MVNFLTFKTFITPFFLMLFYYIGAVLVPFVIYYKRGFIIKKIAINNHAKAFLIFIFFMLEIMWRIMFEFMIGYFQIHNALMQASS